MSTRVKAALIGISGYGDIYLESLLDDPRNQAIDLIGVADPFPNRSRHLLELNKRGVQVAPSMSALFERQRPDLVMLSTPIHLHAAQTCMAVEQGVHVLCEKPLAGCLSDALRMLSAERQGSSFVAIGYQWSFSEAIQSLKRDVMSGLLGRPLRLRSLVSFPRGSTYFHRNDWVGRIRSDNGVDILDSPVNNAAAHYLHNMLYVLGEQRHVSAVPRTLQAEIYRANAIENYDTAMLRCMTSTGVEILFYTTHAMAERVGPVCRFEFENAVVSYDFGNGGEFKAAFKDGRVKSYGDPNQDRHLKVWECVRAVHTGETPACGVFGALPHTLCALAAQSSMPRGIEVLPAQMLHRENIDGDVMVVARGLNAVMSECYEQAKLPSELGNVPWACPARLVQLPDPAKLAADAQPRVSVQVHARGAPSLTGGSPARV